MQCNLQPRPTRVAEGTPPPSAADAATTAASASALTANAAAAMPRRVLRSAPEHARQCFVWLWYLSSSCSRSCRGPAACRMHWKNCFYRFYMLVYILPSRLDSCWQLLDLCRGPAVCG